MGYQSKTKDELIKELQKLHEEYDILKKSNSEEIFELRQTVKLMTKNEELFRTILENSRDGLNMLDLKTGKYFFMSPSQIALTGFTADEILNITKEEAFERTHPDDRLISIKQQEEISNGGSLFGVVEYRWKVKSGEYRWFSDCRNVICNKSGEAIALVGNSRDITERKQSEEKIRSTSLYARNLIEASLDPLVTISIKGKLTDVNAAAEKITGIKRENLIGTDFRDYFTNPSKAKEGYKSVFSKGIVKNYPLTIRHISGREIDVLYNATVYKNEAGEVQGVFAAARDITDRKKIEEELRTSKELLEKLNAHLHEIREYERSQIALNLHDDFGQRLTVLNLDIAWLKSRMGVQSTGVKNKLEEMGLMINESIDSIREISSFLRPAILYELGLVPAFEWQLKKFENQSGIKCHFNCKPKEFQIEDDISLILYRILQESLTNILRHSEASEVVIDLGTTKMNIKLTIKDNGKGIEQEKINSTESMGITGIIERIRSVKGSISIKGIKDKGTVLEISIPLTKIKG